MAVCTHCGRESQGYERYCMSCGQPLNTGAASSAAAGGADGANDGRAGQRISSETSPEAAVPAPAEPSGEPVHTETAVATALRSRLIVYRLATADGGSEDGPSTEVGEFILDGRDIAIGRAPSCDIVLEGDQLASRRHALLRSHPDGFTVVDLGSSNGTYINDLEIREAVLLHEGDHVSIGGHELIYSTSPASPHASLAGVKLAEPEAVPMLDTDPHAAAVSAQETAESPSVSGAYARDARDVTDDHDGAEAPPTAAGSAPEIVPSPSLDAVAPPDDQREQDFASSNFTDADFEELRAQLAEVSAALARKANSEARVIKHLRGALESARDQLAKLVAGSATGEGGMSAGDVSALVTIARQASENPRHLDYLTALAEHAGDIADRLETSQAPGSGIPAPVLEALRAQLDEALG